MFTNQFYSEDDCRWVRFKQNRFLLCDFVRDDWNRRHPHRTPFQRDLDRLVFSAPFRRLQGKTQVRRTGPRCYSRTRLSHSIEIARIASSFVKQLYYLQDENSESFIDLDLVEFACFAHDIGNPPFGHAGERALNACMKDYGGFEGNAQSLRIITEIAWSVSPGNKPTRTGIEPTRAAVELILKYQDLHSRKQDPPEARSKFLYDYQHELLEQLSVPTSRPVECQIMDIADDVGNALMDFADGVRAGIITEDAINKQQAENDVDNTWIQRKITDSLQPNYINRDVAKWIGECVRSLQIEPNECTSRNSYKYNISLGERETAFMTTLRNINRALLFSDREIQASDNSGAFIIKVLFEAFLRHYCEAPSNRLRDEKIIPEDWHQRLNEAEEKDRYRLIADFISGMTDDYAKLIFDMLIETGLTH